MDAIWCFTLGAFGICAASIAKQKAARARAGHCCRAARSGSSLIHAGLAAHRHKGHSFIPAATTWAEAKTRRLLADEVESEKTENHFYRFLLNIFALGYKYTSYPSQNDLGGPMRFWSFWSFCKFLAF